MKSGVRKILREKLGEKGFTLIELILVITVLGILAISALPTFYDVTTNAKTSSRDGVSGAVNSGIALYKSNQLVNGLTPVVPAALDANAAGACSIATPCFSNVITGGVTDGRWVKIAPVGGNPTYTWAQNPGGAVAATYTYNAANETFGQ